MRLRTTAEQEEIDGELSECLNEIVPMQDTVELHRRLSQTSLWVQQARCLSQSGFRHVCHLKYFERRMRHSVEAKHKAALFHRPNQDVRMAMQCDSECLLDDEGFKHINIQTQRRSERQGRTPGFKDSNLNNLVTSDQTNIRRKTGDERRSLILNKIDATRFRSVCLGQRCWILLKQRNMWPVV